MADLRKQLETNDAGAARAADRSDGRSCRSPTPSSRPTTTRTRTNSRTTPQITLREITVTVPVTAQGVNVAQDDEAKAKAEDVRKRRSSPASRSRGWPADFSDSAVEGQRRPGRSAQPRRSLRELQKAIAGLKTGDVTPVLRTARGYQIIKIESLSDSTTKPFEDAKDEIADKIANGKRQGEYVKFIAKLRAEAIIDWKNDEIKKAYEVGLKQAASRSA